MSYLALTLSSSLAIEINEGYEVLYRSDQELPSIQVGYKWIQEELMIYLAKNTKIPQSIWEDAKRKRKRNFLPYEHHLGTLTRCTLDLGKSFNSITLIKMNLLSLSRCYRSHHQDIALSMQINLQRVHQLHGNTVSRYLPQK